WEHHPLERSLSALSPFRLSRSIARRRRRRLAIDVRRARALLRFERSHHWRLGPDWRSGPAAAFCTQHAARADWPSRPNDRWWVREIGLALVGFRRGDTVRSARRAAGLQSVRAMRSRLPEWGSC